jgi:plastocyanin
MRKPLVSMSLPAILLTLVLAGCGSHATAPKQVLPRAADTHPLIVENTTNKGTDAWYDPNPIHAQVGQSITWVNHDKEPHDVTSFDANFSSGPIPYRGSYTWVASRAGTFRYFCTLHPGMHGAIVVQAKQT